MVETEVLVAVALGLVLLALVHLGKDLMEGQTIILVVWGAEAVLAHWA
jgi:hypothetical protein